MYISSSQFGMGVVVHKIQNDIFTTEQAKQILLEYNYYIDYYNGKSIKNYFRKTTNQKQIINITRYDDRTYSGCFYKCILEILNYKMMKQQLDTTMENDLKDTLEQLHNYH